MKTKVKCVLNLADQKSSHTGSRKFCNLCNESFRPRTVFERYCKRCRENNELFKISEYLPDMDLAFEEKLIA